VPQPTAPSRAPSITVNLIKPTGHLMHQQFNIHQIEKYLKNKNFGHVNEKHFLPLSLSLFFEIGKPDLCHFPIY
jgi:hypothetical protein